jgi:hypothetical protein
MQTLQIDIHYHVLIRAEFTWGVFKDSFCLPDEYLDFPESYVHAYIADNPKVYDDTFISWKFRNGGVVQFKH